MTIGIVILAHEHLHRTRQLAKALASRHVKIVIHVDAKTPDKEFNQLAKSVEKNSHILMCERVACEWGRFSLVEAGLLAAETLLARWNNVTHVAQISGSCLPLRSMDELVAFLERQPRRDFVESSCVKAEQWVVDGLASERFSLYFPFSWTRQRRLFDAAVAVQRKFKIKRKMPEGLSPHLGSQWWCLSKRTLKAILEDPEREHYGRFFKRCWIPDEGYIPTLVRKHSRDLVNQSLTMSRFDDQGKPHLFYEDHADLLLQSDQFFVRKIWHGADGLYRRFLNKKRMMEDRSISTDLGMDILFEEARSRRCKGRPGRLTVGRFPAAKYERQPATVMPYGAFIGFSHVYEDFLPWLERSTGTIVHGRLYKKNKVEAAGRPKVLPGGLDPNPLIRDHNPEQYFCNLLWATRGTHQSMMMELSDGERMCAFLAQDPNAQLVVLNGSWVLDLFARDDLAPNVLKRQAKRLLAAEKKFERELIKTGRTDVLRISMLDLLQRPISSLDLVQAHLKTGADVRAEGLAKMRDLSGLYEFVAKLKGLGIDTRSLGDIPSAIQPKVLTHALG